jgi:putative ABC transport system substrate-binding protein
MLNPSLRRRELIALLSGGMAWPLSARAREAAKVPTIGVLWHAGSPDEEQPFFDALKKGFSDLGYVEGQNIRLEHRFPNEIPDRFRSMVAELVASKVDLIVSMSPASNYAKDATGTIPHVFMCVQDPVRQGLVDSLARPGKNVTGLSTLVLGITQKRFHLLRQALPRASSIGLLVDPNVVTSAGIADETRAAAAEAGLTLKIYEAGSVGTVSEAFDAMTTAGIGGLLMGGSGFFYQQRAVIAKLALSHRLPTSVWGRETMGPDTFMSYGASLAAIVRRAPIYVDKILKGAAASDLPVELPTKFELIINLRTARTIGIEVPQMLLAQADEVIE